MCNKLIMIMAAKKNDIEGINQKFLALAHTVQLSKMSRTEKIFLDFGTLKKREGRKEGRERKWIVQRTTQ